MKQLIPTSIRLMIKLLLIRWKDFYTGNHKKFTNQFLSTAGYQYRITVQQSFRFSEIQIPKRHNIELAINKINQIELLPGQIFSFWHLVKKPSESMGFGLSRSIINKTLKTTVGGGLCQLSGLIYHVAIKAGLNIIERHAHSMDIYREEERFTPLGTDATVAYGYKDLRFSNPYPFPISFQFISSKDLLQVNLTAPQPITAFEIEFEQEKKQDFTIVRSFQINGVDRRLISQDKYELYHKTTTTSQEPDAYFL